MLEHEGAIVLELEAADSTSTHLAATYPTMRGHAHSRSYNMRPA